MKKHLSSASNRGSNFISFKNAESDRLIEQARLEFDDEKRKQIYWKWQELIHSEQSALSLANDPPSEVVARVPGNFFMVFVPRHHQDAPRRNRLTR